MNATLTTAYMEASNRLTIGRGAEILRNGGLVAFPTETVYGLGADATNPKAIARLYAAKGRPAHNPLIMHLADPRDALIHGVFDTSARALADALWPGPLTLVVPIASESAIVADARAGLDTVALRCPAHPVARALLAATGRPVAAPSANRSGYVSPTSARHVLDDLDGRIDLIIDGGGTGIGLESTVVACLPEGVELLRPGFVLADTIARAAGCVVRRAGNASDAPLSPGQLESHYAPRLKVRLNVTDVAANEALIDFGADPIVGTDRACLHINLSPQGDLAEAAANLYDALRQCDASMASGIAVAAIPQYGLGTAILDRLTRAAA